MSRLKELIQVRLTQQERLMLERLSSKRKPMSSVIRDLIKKAYLQVQE